MKKLFLTLTALVGLTFAAHAGERLGDLIGGMDVAAKATGDQYAVMFDGLEPENELVVRALKACAVLYGYTDAESVQKFIDLAQEEMRKEEAELAKVQ